MTEETTGPVSGDAAAKTTSFFDPDDVKKAAEVAVEAWVDTLRGSPVSRNTGAWNHIQSSKPRLVELIVQEVTK